MPQDPWQLPVGWSIIHTPSSYDVWADSDGQQYLAKNARSGSTISSSSIFERVMNTTYGVCAEGSIVTINEGLYELGRDVDRITIPIHNVSTWGKGRGYYAQGEATSHRIGATWLRLKDNFGSGEYQAFTASSKQGLNFKDFTLDLNRFNQCVTQTGCARQLVPPDYTKFMHDGFKFTSCPQSYFEGIGLRNILRNGIWLLTSSNNCWVVNCLAEGVEGGDHLWGNRAYGWGAIAAHACGGLQVQGLYAQDCGTAVVFYNSAECMVSGSNLQYNGDGIYIWLGGNHTIAPNNYGANEGNPILIVDATYVDINGGYYFNNPETGKYSESIAIANTVQADGHHTVNGGTFKNVLKAVNCVNSNLNNFKLGTATLCRANAVYIDTSDDCSVKGGIFSENGIATDDTYAHVHITNSNRTSVLGIKARKGTKKPSYGVTILEAGSTDNIVDGNDLRDSGNIGPFLDNGTDTLGANWI